MVLCLKIDYPTEVKVLNVNGLLARRDKIPGTEETLRNALRQWENACSSVPLPL